MVSRTYHSLALARGEPIARAAGLGQAAMNEAAEIKLRAERKAGEALAEMDKAKGGRPEKTDSVRASVSDPLPRLADIGIKPKQSNYPLRPPLVLAPAATPALPWRHASQR